MTSLQFWAAAPELKLSAVMPRPLRADYRFNDHRHGFHELALVFAGECHWRLGRRRLALRADELLLLPPDTRHREVIPAGGAARVGWTGFTLPAAAAVPRALLLRPLAAGPAAEEFRRLFALIFEEHQSGALGSRERTGLLLRELLIVLARLGAAPAAAAASRRRPAPPLGERQAQVARSAARYLTENLARPLSVREVARYHSLCAPHFSSVFRRYHGVPPQRFLHEARVRRAQELVAAGGLAVKEIAAICGYVDAAHFCRRFKEATGLTPKAYRASGRGRPAAAPAA